MAQAPKCKICGANHWGAAHIWPDDPKPAKREAPASAKPKPHAAPKREKPEVANAPMANGVANTASTYRYRDAEKRRAYQADLMRKKRAAAKV